MRLSRRAEMGGSAPSPTETSFMLEALNKHRSQ